MAIETAPAAAPPARRRVTRAILKELVLGAICLAAAYPIAGFIYGVRDSDAGWALDMNLADGLAAGIVMAIQATTSFGFVSLGGLEEVGGDGEVVNLYPLILRCAIALYVVARLASLAIGRAYRRRRMSPKGVR
jgi:hypothetical protein